MTSADTIKGWNLLLWLTSRMLWSELYLIPLYRGVLDGIPVCLDGSVALGATQCSTVRDQAVHRVVDVPMAHWAWRRRIQQQNGWDPVRSCDGVKVVEHDIEPRRV